MTPTRIALAALALLVSVPAADAAGETFRAQGNEPFWSLHRSAEAIVFKTMDGAAVTVAPVPEPASEGKADVYQASVENETFVLTVEDTVCTDTMSGTPFPKTVTVQFGPDSYSGCGGEPATLLAGDWTVVTIDGEPPIDGTEPSLSFGDDGRISGNASCNRFFGGFTLTGEGLSFGEMGAAMMMCDDPVMAQERAMLDILQGTIGFAIAEDGGLTLSGADGRTIAAAR